VHTLMRARTCTCVLAQVQFAMSNPAAHAYTPAAHACAPAAYACAPAARVQQPNIPATHMQAQTNARSCVSSQSMSVCSGECLGVCVRAHLYVCVRELPVCVCVCVCVFAYLYVRRGLT
jgi:hypothetical protein